MSGIHCTADPTCEFEDGHDSPCPSIRPEAPGSPCRQCRQRVPLDGSPCPTCWEPATQEDVDALYLEAWLGPEERPDAR